MASMSKSAPSVTTKAGTTTRVSSRRGRGRMLATSGASTRRGVGRGPGNNGGKMR